jgi:hypothetical protein
MHTSIHHFKRSAVIALMLLAGCFAGEPPTETDVAAIAQDYLRTANAIGGWKPIEVRVSNLKCNRSGDAYACSFDLQGKLQQINRWNGEITVSNFSHKAQTGKYIKAGDVWTIAL